MSYKAARCKRARPRGGGTLQPSWPSIGLDLDEEVVDEAGDAEDLRGAGGSGCGVGCDWGETRHLGFGLWGRRRTGVRIRQGRAGCGGG